MKLKNKILNWLGLTVLASRSYEVTVAITDLSILRRQFEYYREELCKLMEARAKAKAAVEKSRESRRVKDTIVTTKVNELLSFLGMKRGGILMEPPAVEPIINLTRLVDAVQNLAEKSKETNRLARKCADATGISQEELNVSMSGLAGLSPDYCTATCATRPGYLHERIATLERRLSQSESNAEVLRKAHNDLSEDLNRVLAALKLQIVNTPASSTPAKREVRKVKGS